MGANHQARVWLIRDCTGVSQSLENRDLGHNSGRLEIAKGASDS